METMNWSSRRKFFYSLLVLIALSALVAPLVYYFYPKPSCFDGKQNQDEAGIDCDGSCAKVCVERTSPLKVLFTRQFLVSNNVYSVVAFVGNPNATLGAKNVPYIFKLYDERNILVAERRGSTDVLPGTSFPVFEGLIAAGARAPIRAFFEFTRTPHFERLPDQPLLSVRNTQFDDTDPPRLTATIVNQNIFQVQDISVVVMLYDAKDTVIAASQTLLDTIEKNGSAEVVFTWPQKLASPVGRIEIFPKFLKVQ